MEASLQERVYDAAATGDSGTLESLLRSSSELGDPRLLEWRDQEGRTPLIIAALKNHEQCVEMLLASKADVTCQGEDGTALHYAICKGASHTSICKLLLANAANPFVQNLMGDTPLQEAMAEHMYDVVDIMRQMVLWSGIADVKVFDNARLRARRITAGRPQEEDEIEEVVPQELMECLVVLEPVFSSPGGHYKVPHLNAHNLSVT
ncbi:ankyrin repeat-containing domain protein [Haematococcus lacustris]